MSSLTGIFEGFCLKYSEQISGAASWNCIIVSSVLQSYSKTLKYIWTCFFYVRHQQCGTNKLWHSYHLHLTDCYSMRFDTLSNYHLIDWWCDACFCLLTWWFVSSFFCYSNLSSKTGGLELSSNITFVLQTIQLTKCVSHPKYIPLYNQLIFWFRLYASCK